MGSDPVQFGGQEHFRAAPETLYALLTDLDAMVGTIPDLVSSERVDDHTLKCVVRPGFSFLRGTLRLKLTLSDLVPPESAAMLIAAEGIGVSMSIPATFSISSEGAGSLLTWTARLATVKGLAAALSPGLLKAAADQVIRHAWVQVRQRLGE